jgi:hypothetical protein
VRFEFSWLLSHPQAAELTDRELRCWLAVVAGAVRLDRDDGSFKLDELERFSTSTGSRRVRAEDLARFRELGLLVDAGDGRWRIREWVAWSVSDATSALRGRLWRERQRRSKADRERARAEEAARQIDEWRNPPPGAPRTGIELLAAELEQRDEPGERDENVPAWPSWGRVPSWPESGS